jgi:hypothetical protein
MSSKLSLISENKGVGTIEFAIIAPVLALLLMGMADLGRALAAKYHLESAAHRALERATTLQGQIGADSLRLEAAAGAGEPLSHVTLESWLECEGVRQPVFDGECPTGSEIARYLRLNIISNFTPTFSYGPLGKTFGESGPNGTFRISARAGMRIQ